jgi:hypothetical protein
LALGGALWTPDAFARTAGLSRDAGVAGRAGAHRKLQDTIGIAIACSSNMRLIVDGAPIACPARSDTRHGSLELAHCGSVVVSRGKGTFE